MKNEYPLLSFCTPCYNDGDTIARMVNSIMDQDYPSIEQIIVVDGSTDHSKRVLKKLEKKYPDKLKVIYWDKNQGACQARNEAAKHAKGKYLSFLPADAYLYPGMARIWMDLLEENPQYDFVYGGYKITDKNFHEIFSYLSDDFGPYFLDISNYIDGSFPLKRTLFDKMAKANDKHYGVSTGAWDSNIKSLQDWDFWLNAVKWCGAKGLFRKEIFFETVQPHPGGLSYDSHQNWLARTKTIKDKFGIPIRKVCVTAPGARFHGRNVAKYLDADFRDQMNFKPHDYEVIYIVGFFGNVAESLSGTRAIRVLHWIGSDILQLQQTEPEVREKVVDWIYHNIDINLCEFEKTRVELEELGIYARILPFPPEKFYEMSELPDKTTIACYLPMQNKNFYYPDLVRQIAKEMPDVEFQFFGDPSEMGKKENIEHLGVIGGEAKDKAVKESTAILRLTAHDGLPLSVVEWITAGRYAITTIEMPHSRQVKINKDEIKKAIEELKNIIEPNIEGSKYYKELCSPEKFRKGFNKLLEFNPKEWWDQMADIWINFSHTYGTAEDVRKIIKEIRELKPENILEIGCGDGRWCDILPEPYLGIDFSKYLVEKAKEKYPDKKFVITDILDFKPDKKYDLVFSFTTWLHVKPEDMPKYIEKIKQLGKRAVFIEPIAEGAVGQGGRWVNPKIIEKIKKGFIYGIKYTVIHDYQKLFKVEKMIPMDENRTMFVIDLE